MTLIKAEIMSKADGLLFGGDMLASWLEGNSVEHTEPGCADIEFQITDSSYDSSSKDSSAGLSDRAGSETASISRLTSDVCCARDSHACITSDGWRLHIEHVYDPISEASSRCGSPVRQHPVLMVPGLASSGEHTFDLLPECSLVEVLVSQGYDVWIADLRGNGRSEKPNPLDSSTWWTVDDHFYKDVPAVLHYVLAHTRAQQLHWIGHSMGGMLAVGLLSQQGRYAAALRSVTLVASGCFGAGSWHSWLKPIILPVTKFGFPAGLVCSAIGALSSFTYLLWFPYLLQGLFYCPSNTPVNAARRLMSNCFRFIPTGVIQQFMGSLNSKHGLCSHDLQFRYADPEALKDCEVPVLGLNGSWDLFCPPAGGKKTIDMLGSKHKQFVCLGPWQGTSRRRYGHFDIMCGYDVHTDVFPYIVDWLDQHDR